MKIGLIAGGGQFPALFSQKAVKKGYAVYAVGFVGETDPDLSTSVDDLKLLYLGQLSKLIKYYKQHCIR